MKIFARWLLIPFACSAVAVDLDASGTHPVESVIKLLKELQGTVRDEGEKEAATFKKFQKWCTASINTLKEAVQSSKDDIDSLTDTVKSLTAEKAATEQKIGFLDDEITKYEGENTQAKKDRDDANKAYQEADKDYDDTIKAIDEALNALKSSKGLFLQFRKPENSRQLHALRNLMQQPMVLEQLSDAQRAALSSAVSDDPKITEDDILAKEKYAKTGETYTFKSNNVIDLLGELKTHFENEKRDATKAETDAMNDYQVGLDAAKAAIEAAKKAKTEKTSHLADVTKDLNTAKSDLKDEKDELAADLKNLDDTKTTCDTKHSEWAERSKLRKHEYEAMEAAVEILAKVSGVRTEAPDTTALPTPPDADAFLQIDNPKMKAVKLIRQEAHIAHSRQLQRLADALAAKIEGDDPFAELDGMIQKMIFRLMDEQKNEDEHKRWCDLELETSNTSKVTKEKKIELLDAQIKDAKAAEVLLAKKIESLDEKVAKLQEFMDEATEVRKDGKKENTLAIKDAEAAQEAIAKAEAVLTSYYKDSGMIAKQPWEFLQQPEPVDLPKQPSTWSSSYTGVADPTKANEGVIAVLKATAADFAKMEADTRAQELSDQKQFDKDMKESKIDKAKNMKESEMKTDERKRTLDNINAMTKQKKHTESELGAVEQYLKDLAPACLDGDSTYVDRKKARDDEIKALKEAQVILKDAFADDGSAKSANFLHVSSSPRAAAPAPIHRH